MDVFSFPNLIQVESPHFQVVFVSLLGSLFKFGCHVIVCGGDELPGSLVPLVQPLQGTQALPITMARLEGRCDNLRLLVHELLGCSAAAGFGGELLMKILEDWEPTAVVMRLLGRGTVTEPLGDFL